MFLAHIWQDKTRRKGQQAYNRKQDKLLQEILGVVSTEVSKVGCEQKGKTECVSRLDNDNAS